MNDNQFLIYKPSTKFRYTANHILYTLFIVIFVASISVAKLNAESIMVDILTIMGCLVIITMVVLLVVSNFLRESIHGELNGILELKENAIIADNLEIQIDNVERIDFSYDDYVGSWLYNKGRGRDFTPKLSNGVKNYCEIIMSNGDLHKVYFQQENRDDLLKNRELIIQYHLKGKISLLRLTQMLEIEGYENVQAFKKEIYSINDSARNKNT